MLRSCPFRLVRGARAIAGGLFAPTRTLLEVGTVAHWNFSRGFGIVNDDDTQQGYFVHVRDCVFADGVGTFTTLAVDQRVEFALAADTTRDDNRQKCVKVTQVGGEPLPRGPIESKFAADPAAQRRERFSCHPGEKDVVAVATKWRGSHGFVKPEGRAEIFVHVTALVDADTTALNAGDHVLVDVIANEKRRSEVDAVVGANVRVTKRAVPPVRLVGVAGVRGTVSACFGVFGFVQCSDPEHADVARIYFRVSSVRNAAGDPVTALAPGTKVTFEVVCEQHKSSASYSCRNVVVVAEP